MKLFERGVIVAGLVLAGVAANAQTIVLDSQGTWQDRSDRMQTETVLYPPSTTYIYPVLTDLSLIPTVDGSGNPLSAIATYSDSAGDILRLQLTVMDYQYFGNSFSMDGTWTLISASSSGGYDSNHVSAGLGTFSVTQADLDTNSGFSGTILTGRLIPAPEPASMAFLGLGVVGLVARRRRKI